MTYKPYAGIGSRKTPPAVIRQMTELADVLDQLGFTLRSGAAPGADAAFEAGVSSNRKEIFLPWRGFQGSTSSFYPPSREAYDLAMRHHPNWWAMRRGGRALQARNSHQVLGQNLNSPVLFVVAWTPDGAEEQTTRQTGGTGQAIRIAAARGIPVFNLARPDGLFRLKSLLQRLA
ncbi:hypothetical protein CMI37_17845 [Candidatus Pacearchaeota archaeon]|nr:hypothetical protein [Candidatus Pacearchaeota archaeon]